MENSNQLSIFSFSQDEMPETIIGETVVVKGELKFERLLRINGICTGQLISQVCYFLSYYDL